MITPSGYKFKIETIILLKLNRIIYTKDVSSKVKG
jgi:hypothetical protein